MKRWSRLLIGALIALSVAALSLAVRAVLSGRDEPQVRARLAVLAEETTGFAQAEGTRTGGEMGKRTTRRETQIRSWLSSQQAIEIDNMGRL